MKVYHSSTVRIVKPDTGHSRKYLDFGPGFYLTTIKEQAVKYAERFIRRGYSAWLNIYEMKEDLSAWKVLRFDNYDGQWLDYVANCRKGNIDPEHDIIIGGIANDRVFRTIDLYFSGEITKDEALNRLIFEKPNMQICLCSEEAIKDCLTYIDSLKL